MHMNMPTPSIRNFILLSLLIHLLLFLSFSLVLNVTPIQEKPPGLLIPAYLSQASKVITVQAKQSVEKIENKNQAQQKTAPVKKEDHASLPLLAQKKSQLDKKQVAHSPTSPSKRRAQLNAINISKDAEPVHLIGDKNIEKPLLTLLGKALTAHLVYPRLAIEFNLRGMAVIRFTLHPRGHITNAQLVQSSGAGVLDEEALTAVNAISPLQQADKYLKEPKVLVVGIKFN